MAEASPLLITVTPKELGRHLREVRRKKGLSLSEVARGAGLSRRELVAYERGKVPIPENDLWVLAGSCGVDASELVPRTTTPELPSGPTSMGDTVAQLRRGQDDAGLAPYLATLNRLQALPPGKRIPVKERELEEIATALGRDPDTIESRLSRVMHVSPAEAARLREIILPPVGGRNRPRAIEAAPQFTEMAGEAPGAVDVFEELARLPEPMPLPDPGAPIPDMFATPPPPEGAVELVDSAVPMSAAASGPGVPAPVLVDSAAVAWSAADAPPIDVALRQSSDAWADWGKVPGPAPIDGARRVPSPEASFGGAPSVDTPAAPDSGQPWEPPPWQPPGSDDGIPPGGPPSFWEGTDDWAPPAALPTDGSDDVPVDAWTSHEWPSDLSGEPAVDDHLEGQPAPYTFNGEVSPLLDEAPASVDTWTHSPGSDETPWSPDSAFVADQAEYLTASAPDTADAGPWAHDPDPEAVSTGFYVDWGTPGEDEPPAWHALIGPDPESDASPLGDGMGWRDRDTRAREPGEPFFAEPEFASPDFAAPDFAPDFGEAVAEEPYSTEATGYDAGIAFEPVSDPGFDSTFHTAIEPQVDLTFDADPTIDLDPALDDGGLAPIRWRADGFDTPATEAHEPAAADVPTPDIDPTPRFESDAPIGDYAIAGADWQLGNALPLVEVHGQGTLVMRRADERWALADLTTPPECVIEVDVDFRSGPGLGVLFRASVDDEGRMSAYSFDIDPIYDGGGYLVRQWQSDRELWNPIARVAATDPNSMYGMLTVTLVLRDDNLVARVNGAEVLTVESLKQASADRGREAATGNRVGVQAWSSSDLVIETLRVAGL